MTLGPIWKWLLLVMLVVVSGLWIAPMASVAGETVSVEGSAIVAAAPEVVAAGSNAAVAKTDNSDLKPTPDAVMPTAATKCCAKARKCKRCAAACECKRCATNGKCKLRKGIKHTLGAAVRLICHKCCCACDAAEKCAACHRLLRDKVRCNVKARC